MNIIVIKKEQKVFKENSKIANLQTTFFLKNVNV